MSILADKGKTNLFLCVLLCIISTTFSVSPLISAQTSTVSNVNETDAKETANFNNSVNNIVPRKPSQWNFTPPEIGSDEYENYWREFWALLTNKDFNLSNWKSEIENYFKERSFTIQHIHLWDTLISSSTDNKEKIPYYAGIFACLALLAELKKPTPNIDAVVLASQHLLKIIDILEEKQIRLIADEVESQLSSKPILLVELWNRLSNPSDPQQNPAPISFAEQYEAIIYCCLTIHSIFDKSKFLRVVQCPEPMQSFYRNLNILLFDNGTLTPEHLQSLESIFRAIPPTLHRISAILVPEGIGISASKLIVSKHTGIAIDIPLIPITVHSSPFEFPVSILPQTAPEFSLQVIMQIVRAIQLVQFQLRPELLFRRNNILANANRRGYNFLRQTVQPDLYFTNPDELLPNAAYLWFLNSDKALIMANDCLKMRQHFPSEVFLLLADLLSEGKNFTYAFYLNEVGILNVMEAPVARLPIDPGFPAVISISPERLQPQPFQKHTQKLPKAPN